MILTRKKQKEHFELAEQVIKSLTTRIGYVCRKVFSIEKMDILCECLLEALVEVKKILFWSRTITTVVQMKLYKNLEFFQKCTQKILKVLLFVFIFIMRI